MRCKLTQQDVKMPQEGGCVHSTSSSTFSLLLSLFCSVLQSPPSCMALPGGHPPISRGGQLFKRGKWSPDQRSHLRFCIKVRRR